MNRQILFATRETDVRAYIENDRHIHGSVAPSHVVVAVSRLVGCHEGVPNLPEHLDVFTLMTDRHLTNTTHDLVVGPATERCLVVDEIFEVELGATNFCVDECSFIRL